eukprot:TRINITY_DN818_c0_g2_i3.p1 TRINITY_DN818_c0_g2~~TRINITY_DN818_c0_g2_i3.p1  ORF type:complete len:527 (+),score=119.26 TRINITY_DN818_c0_g2_i3:1865-3445(+)
MINKSIRLLRTDGGSEYSSKLFQQFLRSRGVLNETTAPGSPQQNSVAEHRLHVLFSTTRALLSESGLNRNLWPEAMYHSNLLLNICYHHSYEIIHGAIRTKRLISRIVTFGAPCFYVDSGREKKKLDPRASAGRVIGCSTSNYKILDAKTSKIVLSTTITADETPGSQFTDLDRFTFKSPSVTFSDIVEDFSIDNSPSLVPLHEPVAAAAAPVHDGGNDGIESKNDDGIHVINENNLHGGNDILQPTVGGENHGGNDETKGDEDENVGFPRRSDNVTAQPEIVFVPRRSSRITAQPDRLLFSFEPADPMSCEEAKSDPLWVESIRNELEELQTNGTFAIESRDVEPKMLKTKWVFRTKRDGRRKSRLTACGYSQRPILDFDSTYSPVVSHMALAFTLALIAAMNLFVVFLDVPQAFVQSDLDKEIFLNRFPGHEVIFPNLSANSYIRLSKSLYGLRQASHLFNKLLLKVLRDLRFQSSTVDTCFMYRVFKDFIIVVIMHVDDLLTAGNNQRHLDEFVCCWNYLSKW